MTSRWVPYSYSTLLAPLGVMLHKLEQRGAVADDYARLDRWYWSAVFTQRYDAAVDTKSAQDIRDVMAWIGGNPPPEWIATAARRELDLAVSESRSALYRGVMCLIVQHGARDLLTGQSPMLAECDDDHLFPRARYGSNDLCNTILNRTLISSHTNRKRKKDTPPSVFLRTCLEGHGDDEARLLNTLATRLINRDAYEAAVRDDFDAFVAARKQAILSAIAERLGGADSQR